MAEKSEKFENIILVPCSGSEYHGELARQAAIRLAEKSKIASVSSMTCSTIFLKNVLLEKEKLVEITKNHLRNSYTIILNGCNTACTSLIYKNLDIKNDKPARRVLVSLNEQGEIVFFTVFDRDLVFQGPFLSELPKLLQLISSKLGIEIIDALNLDGGTASVFYSGDISLQELTNVGGFFCIK